jgi:hypothetical protein
MRIPTSFAKKSLFLMAALLLFPGCLRWSGSTFATQKGDEPEILELTLTNDPGSS